MRGWVGVVGEDLAIIYTLFDYHVNIEDKGVPPSHIAGVASAGGGGGSANHTEARIHQEVPLARVPGCC